MEKTDSHTTKSRLSVIIILISLLTPLLQQFTQVLKTKGLDGYFKPAIAPHFTLQNWIDGTYQDSAAAYLNENFGFRADLVRVRNQIEFSLWQHTYAGHIYVGKNDYLFTIEYEEAYYGRDYIGIDSINNQLTKLKLIQDTLAKLSVEFAFVFAPGKAAYMPEHLPSSNDTITDFTNQKMTALRMKTLGINHIDFAAWFNQMKDTTNYPLYPKTGIHWSSYGALLASDSSINYMRAKTGYLVPKAVNQGLEIRENLHNDDRDLERSMNLLFKIPNQPMAYQLLGYPNKHNRDTVFKSLVVGDSYYWQIHHSHYRLWKYAEFWYYNRVAQNVVEGQYLELEDLDRKKHIEEKDFIMILATDAQLKKMTWGWIDDTYKLYFAENN